MMKSFFQIKIIRRYLFSYLLLFFLPLAVLNSIFNFYFQQSLQKELILNQQALLEKLQLSVEAELSKFSLISRQLTLNGFDSYNITADPVKGINLIRFLGTQKNVNPFLSDIVIYYKDRNFFYSCTSSYSPEYFNQLYTNQPDMLHDLSNFFNSPFSMYTAPPSIVLPSSSDHQKNLALVYPVTSNGLTSNALLFFFITSDKLEKLCAQYYNISESTVLLTNQDGELLSIYGRDSTGILNTFETGVIQLKSSEPAIQTIGGTKYLISTAGSDFPGWSYTACTQIDSALATSIALRNQQFIFTLLATLIGGFLILLCMYYNYLPLYHLIDLAAGLSMPRRSTYSNELDNIADILSRLSSENTQLSSQLENTKTAAKEYIISQLLIGHSLKREYLELSLVKTILSPHFDTYTVFVAKFLRHSPLLDGTKTELIQEIEAFSNEDIVFYCKEDHVSDTFVCIVLMNHHITPRFSAILNSMRECLNTFMNGNMACGVGNNCELMESLGKSYIEASTALDYRFIKGTDCIIFFASVEANVQGAASAYPYDRVQQFRLALTEGSTRLLEESLNGIFSFLSQEDMNLFQAKSICQDMIRIVSGSMPDMQSDSMDGSVFPDVFLLLHFETVNDIITMIRQFGYNICKHISKSYDENNQILVENIRNFITDKGYDYNFSQELLAAHFHMAVPNLSAFYKEHTGENINETVTRLRMDKAQFLLSTTSLPINQIAVNVGYDNVSSFIRRFKQIYHMPPGVWREHH